MWPQQQIATCVPGLSPVHLCGISRLLAGQPAHLDGNRRHSYAGQALQVSILSQLFRSVFLRMSLGQYSFVALQISILKNVFTSTSVCFSSYSVQCSLVAIKVSVLQQLIRSVFLGSTSVQYALVLQLFKSLFFRSSSVHILCSSLCTHSLVGFQVVPVYFQCVALQISFFSSSLRQYSLFSL